MSTLHTSDDIAIASAIISNPVSILAMFLMLPAAISRLDRLNAMPAVSFPSTDEVRGFLIYCANAFSRSSQVFRNFANNLVGGFSDSKI